ncbi:MULTISPECIES: hypothetical protein [Achromobacter]|uniref:Uncharacterized protein n=1 Tax=Achromobacter piechaudii TaxID=72556 RepID=A0A6S7DJH7_9BURK|nr:MULTISPECIES: hypothetical protein [Achromobacter]MPS81049.1 hypothetical protein [Achromobacter sp.]CAB3854450.1 hypothetical protein LMG1861_01981 [Achromobacter piechaudii]
MIPVSLPGGNFYVLMVASLACLATLLTWLAVLATTPSARLWLGDHRRIGTTLMTLLALVGAIFPYQQFGAWFSAQRAAEADAGRKTTLAHATRLAGVDMPAGTVLSLTQPGDLASFDRAVFPDAQPAAIQGVSATRLFRYAATPKQAETLSVEIARDQAQEGWLCAHGHRLEFVMQGGQPRFASCHLAVGNTLDQQPVPPGAWLKVDEAARGTPPAAGGNAPRWLLRTEGSEALALRQMPLLKVDMRLDSQRRLLDFEGLLARETTLGAMTYPPGTRVLAANPRLPGAQPGDLLFSPSRGRSARRNGGEDVGAGSSVLQAPDGTVRSVLSNREAGVLDVAAMRMAP